MKRYLDTEEQRIYTEAELKQMYREADTEVMEAFPMFGLWLNEITGKNGVMIPVYDVIRE